jgi:hypothetical protein
VSNGSVDEFERQRATRRRHLLERQAVIFGGLITSLLALALVGLAIWFGAVPAPFSVPFSTPTPVDTTLGQPCPPQDATPVPYGQITVNVYNGTTRGGLAAATASELESRGLKIAARANDPYGRYYGATLVRSGPDGLAQAYTVAALFPDAVVQLDAREDATVDVTLGSEYDALRPPAEAALDPDQPIPAPAGCYPATVQGDDQAGDDQAGDAPAA